MTEPPNDLKNLCVHPVEIPDHPTGTRSGPADPVLLQESGCSKITGFTSVPSDSHPSARPTDGPWKGVGPRGEGETQTRFSGLPVARWGQCQCLRSAIVGLVPSISFRNCRSRLSLSISKPHQLSFRTPNDTAISKVNLSNLIECRDSLCDLVGPYDPYICGDPLL